MEFIRSVLVQDVTPASDGIYTYDLPVNPLSHIVLTLKALNNGANTKATLAQLLGALEKVEVLHEGSAVVSLNGADLYALDCVLLGREPIQENVINTANATRAISLVIPLGRSLYNPNECFFGVKKGELQLQIQIDIADTGYSGVIFQIETVELPGASPSNYLKSTTLSYTPAATGEVDVDLPIGAVFAGILLWATTVPTGTAWTATIDWVKLLKDNKEFMYSKTNWESLHGDLINRIQNPFAYAEKIHMENTATAYTANADTAAEEQVASDLANYAYMEFDPSGRDEFLVQTQGLSRFHLRINAGDTNALRIIPVRLVGGVGAGS